MDWSKRRQKRTKSIHEGRVERLRRTVEGQLGSEFVKSIQNAKAKGSTLSFHQDSFAADLDDDEYMLLGMMVKYAGLHGVRVLIGGENGTALGAEQQIENQRTQMKKDGLVEVGNHRLPPKKGCEEFDAEEAPKPEGEKPPA